VATTPAPDRKLWSVNDAVSTTGIGRTKIYELMANGEIEAVKIGKRRLIPDDALDDFIDRLRQEATDETAPPRPPAALVAAATEGATDDTTA